MRFGPQFERLKIPEWASRYIHYTFLVSYFHYLYGVKQTSSVVKIPLLPMREVTTPDEKTLECDSIESWIDLLRGDCNTVKKFCELKFREYTTELQEITEFVKANLEDRVTMMAMNDHPDPRHRLPSLRRAIQSCHRSFWTLEVYVEVNQIALKKLVKKLKKIVTEEEFERYNERIINEFYPYQKQLQQIRRKIYRFSSECITHKDIKWTKQFFLRAEVNYKLTDIAIISFCFGVLLVCIVASVVLVTEMDSLTQIVPSFCVYRMIASFTFMLWTATLILYVFEYYSINWLFIFEIKQRTALSFIKIMKTASIWSAIWGATFLAHTMYRVRMGDPDADIISLISFISFMAVWFIPLHVMYLTVRKELLWVVLNIIMSPFGKVEFVHFYTGDVVTSLSKPLCDLYRSFCFFTSSAWLHKRQGNCSNENTWLYLLSVLPYWWRFMQCWNRYYYTRQWFPHIVNAGKYASGIIAISLSYFHATSDPDESLMIYIVVYIVATLYLLSWDILMDFGFRRFFTSEGRKQRLFPNYYYYYIFISDLILRYAWILTVMPSSMMVNPYLQVEIMLLIVSLLEIFRRAQWTLFRVENEKFSNIEKYRHVDFVPKMPKVIMDE